MVTKSIRLSEEEAANYEAPFEYLRAQVKPEREKNARESYRRLWWRHVEARPALWITLRSGYPVSTGNRLCAI